MRFSFLHLERTDGSVLLVTSADDGFAYSFIAKTGVLVLVLIK